MENFNQWKPVFFKFWFTQALSLIGSGIASFSLVWWITETTGSPVVLTMVSLATLLPGILIGPLAGAVVDQRNRKLILIITDAISAILALLLVFLFWMNWIQIWHIITINILRALANTFQFPAVQSSTSLMVPEEHLARVSGLNQALQGVSMVATPPLGALLLSLLPIHALMGIDMFTAAIAIVLLLSINIPQPSTRQSINRISTTVWEDVRAGFAFIRQWPALINIMLIAALLNLVLTPAFTLIPILVTHHFSGSVFQLGWINAAYGIGTIGGGALLGVWGGFKRRIFTSLLGLAGLGIGSFMIGISPRDSFWIATTGMALVGIMNVLANGPFFAIMQSIVPPEIQGRVFTVLMSISMSMAPIGLAIAGPLAKQLGVQFWYILGALICGMMVVWIILSPALLHLEEKRIHLATAESTAN